MQLRMARKGPNAGKHFLGCSTHPNCSATLPIADDQQPKFESTKGSKSHAPRIPGMRSPFKQPSVPLAPGVHRPGKGRRSI
jgi:hypothetical protein